MHGYVVTYTLDALGAFGIIIGGYVASRSVYARENSKDAALLIDTQRKRIDLLVDELSAEKVERKKLHDQVHHMAGELKAYKKLSYIEPDVIAKLSSTMDAILVLLKEKNE